MPQTLIVARMNPVDAPAVADIWTESDATELPRLLGVTRRSVFRFHDLYFHLVETDRPVVEPLRTLREHPLFVDVNTKLARHIRPYSSQWREPRDAMADIFYQWQP